VELLTVLAIISLLAGILIPAVSAVKRGAKEAKQTGQFLAIELGLTAFMNDRGEYPESSWVAAMSAAENYCGAQKMTEALLGWDLLGFHRRSRFTFDGAVYDPADLSERRPVQLETANAFKLSDLFVAPPVVMLAPDTYVLCDMFTRTKVRLPNGKSAMAGAPILYYRANSSAKTIQGAAPHAQRVYNIEDNWPAVAQKEAADNKGHPLGSATPPGFANQDEFFYGPQAGPPVPGKVGYIQDPKITTKVWPYNPSSYILISAGADGVYGTGDDITNFGN